MKTKTIVLLAVLLAGSDQVAPAADNLSAALQQGLLEEEANHNLEAAIQAYQSVVDQFGDQRKIAATALFRLGECYRKQGKTNEATLQYQRVLADFPDQAALIGPSEKNLAALGRASNQGEGRSIADTDKVDEETKAIERYKTLAENSPDLLNAKDHGGFTPLHNAAGRGEMAVAKFLLANGADISSRDSQGFTPLHNAARSDQKPMMDLLLSHHAEVNAKSSGGMTPLHLAASKGFLSVTETLLANGADPNAAASSSAIEPFLTDARFGNPQPDQPYFAATPLHYAAAGGYLAIVRLLLDHKADVNAKCIGGQTPLFDAVERDRLEVSKLLLANHANPNVKAINGPSLFGVAVGLQNLEMLKLLLAAGADVNAKGILSGRVQSSSGNIVDNFLSPLAFAAQQGKTELADLLLKKKADVNSQDGVFNTPLSLASQYGHVKMVKLLLENGADPTIDNREGEAPLHLSRSKEISGLLLAAKADPNAKNQIGRTPLHNACVQGTKELVEFLLSKGADVNAADANAQTPLFLAVLALNKENIESLIAHGADVKAKDKSGQTPLGHISSRVAQTGVPTPASLPAAGFLFPGRQSSSLTASPLEVAEILRKHGATE